EPERERDRHADQDQDGKGDGERDHVPLACGGSARPVAISTSRHAIWISRSTPPTATLPYGKIIGMRAEGENWAALRSASGKPSATRIQQNAAMHSSTRRE